jgi:3-deoxy-7-phosphoheptulonate synthase
MVEVHHQPDKALSDGPQSIYPDQFARMMDEIEQIAPVVNRTLPHGVHVEPAAEGSTAALFARWGGTAEVHDRTV